MNKYEAVFILDIRKVEDEGKAFTEELTGLITNWGGTMEESISLGRKQFAREIQKRKAGIYWNYIFTLPPEKADGIHDQFRLDERVIREMVIIYDRPEKVEKTEEAEKLEKQSV